MIMHAADVNGRTRVVPVHAMDCAHTMRQQAHVQRTVVMQLAPHSRRPYRIVRAQTRIEPSTDDNAMVDVELGDGSAEGARGVDLMACACHMAAERLRPPKS